MNDSRIAGYRRNKRTGGKFPVDKDGNPIKLESNKKEKKEPDYEDWTSGIASSDEDAERLEKYYEDNEKSTSKKELTDKDINDMQIYFGRSNKQDIINGFNNGEFNKQDIEDAHNFVASEKYRGSPNADQYFKNNVYLTDEEYNDKVRKIRDQDNIDEAYMDTAKKDQERSKKFRLRTQTYFGSNDLGEWEGKDFNEARENFFKENPRYKNGDFGMVTGSEVKEDNNEFYEHDLNIARQAYKSSMGDKKEFLRKMRQDYNWDNEDAKKYYDKVNSDRENALSGVPNAKNDKYKAYYEKENLGTPSNYKPGDEIEFDTGYFSTLKGKVIKEADDKEKKYQMNMNIKGYIVRDKYGFEHVVPDTRILNREKMVEKTNKAYKDNKPIIDSNKKTTNETMNNTIRNKVNEKKALNNAWLKYKEEHPGTTMTKNQFEKDIYKK